MPLQANASGDEAEKVWNVWQYKREKKKSCSDCTAQHLSIKS